jgi:prevent-host-death family protein
MEMSSNTKGAVAEQAIVLAATRLRIPVWRPVSEHGRADLVLEIGGNLFRVQVKWGRLSAARDVIVVTLFTSRCTTRGHIHGTYSATEVDLFAVYCGELDRCFLLPAQAFASRTAIHLRLTQPRNAQRACINLASSFDFAGAVAQLARAPHWQCGGQGFESPQLHSENIRDAPPTVGADACRTQFGAWIERVRAGEDVVVTRRGRPMIRLTSAVPAVPSGPSEPAPRGNAAPAQLFPFPADAA